MPDQLAYMPFPLASCLNRRRKQSTSCGGGRSLYISPRRSRNGHVATRGHIACHEDGGRGSCRAGCRRCRARRKNRVCWRAHAEGRT